jgi:hypothetical protein
VLNAETGNVHIDNFMSEGIMEDANLDAAEPINLRVSIDSENGVINMQLNGISTPINVSPGVTNFRLSEFSLTGDLTVSFLGFVKKGN